MLPGQYRVEWRDRSWPHIRLIPVLEVGQCQAHLSFKGLLLWDHGIYDVLIFYREYSAS